VAPNGCEIGPFLHASEILTCGGSDCNGIEDLSNFGSRIWDLLQPSDPGPPELILRFSPDERLVLLFVNARYGIFPRDRLRRNMRRDFPKDLRFGNEGNLLPASFCQIH
ncbi:MAG: hypothetical protein LBR22_09285, partial [Desulfovibrio sp.]|nr:hypothetical protein [Desulfovibrio sp.]